MPSRSRLLLQNSTIVVPSLSHGRTYFSAKYRMPGNGRSHAEETPLLHSQTSTAEPQIEINDVQTKFDATNPPVTTLRGTAIFLSLFTLVFLQGRVLLHKQHAKADRNHIIAANTSLMTTMQSTVARDLDAYSSTSWFTSAYLVSSHGIETAHL